VHQLNFLIERQLLPIMSARRSGGSEVFIHGREASVSCCARHDP